ncbi:TPA: hypothetical protein OVK45_001460, partial [Staphylococcus aureus]|nr:hypothetical protein [Staphylococcus aureus]
MSELKQISKKIALTTTGTKPELVKRIDDNY